MKKYISKSKAIHPEIQEPVQRTCFLCIEPGATKRKCCNALYCDHCYIKNGKCPNCDVETKIEKRTGATFQVKAYSEHEECRVCLEPGQKRPCCNNYYCDNCFYRNPNCRSCGTPVGNIGDAKRAEEKARLVSVVWGWTVTIFIILATISITGLILANEVNAPVGIFDFNCYGFFRSCGFYVCIDLDQSVADGYNPLPPLSSWRRCDLDSQVKLQSRACIYDRLLYFQSERQLGFDVCTEHFDEGVYVFEDNFENWRNTSFTSNRMRSALWNNVVNGISSTFCGSGNHFGGTNAMTFGGNFNRFAETKDLDVSSGGWIEFEMFMPPIGFDTTEEFCKTGFIGTVFVDYSIDQGGNWTTLESFDPSLRRQESFFKSQLLLPQSAMTEQTRFRFIQPTFEEARDHWALDNVKVLRFLPNNWDSSSSFRMSVKYAWDMIQKAQCCLDTDWCSRRFSEKEVEQCSELFTWYTGQDYLVRLSEILLCFAVLVNILKFIYISFQDWFMKSRYPFQDEILELLRLPMLSVFWSYLPIRLRASKMVVDEFTTNIHRSARMEEDLRNEFADEEGDGEIVERAEVIAKQKKAERKKLKKEKKRLEERRKQKNFKESSLEEVIPFENPFDNSNVVDPSASAGPELVPETDDIPLSTTLVSPNQGQVGGKTIDKILSADDVKYGEGVLPSELDKFRRQNLAILRLPIVVEIWDSWRKWFAAGALTVFGVFFLLVMIFSRDFLIHEPVKAFGVFDGDIYLTSYLVILFATACDFKEIFYTLKYVIPARDTWVPLVTVDFTDDVNALIVANHVVPIPDIQEINTFPEGFIKWCAAGYAVGIFPWALFSFLLREAFLEYSSMRFVTPLLGAIVIIRAVLGAGTLLKVAFSFAYLFDVNYESREKIGLSFQTENTRNIAVNFSATLAVLALLICSAVAFYYLGVIFAACLVGGALYGAFTGCYHELPLRPWMYITALRGGVWLRVRRRQRCPCIYWGKYCTPMHNYDEILVVFTEDETKFIGLLNGGVAEARTLS